LIDNEQPLWPIRGSAALWSDIGRSSRICEIWSDAGHDAYMLDLLIVLGVIVLLAVGFYLTRGAGGRDDLSLRTRVADTTSPLGDSVPGDRHTPDWTDDHPD
jgi:hypothetical protein